MDDLKFKNLNEAFNEDPMNAAPSSLRFIVRIQNHELRLSVFCESVANAI